MWSVGALSVAGGAGYYYYSQGNGSLLAGSSGETKGIFTPKFEDYQKVYNEIAARLEEKDDYDDGSYGRSEDSSASFGTSAYILKCMKRYTDFEILIIGPVLVRLAWHASGTFDKETGTGGSNGATMRFAPEGDHGANAGLVAARDFLEPIKRKHSSLCTCINGEYKLTSFPLDQQKNSHGSPTPIFGSSPASAQFKKCKDQQSPTDPVD